MISVKYWSGMLAFFTIYELEYSFYNVYNKNVILYHG